MTNVARALAKLKIRVQNTSFHIRLAENLISQLTSYPINIIVLKLSSLVALIIT